MSFNPNIPVAGDFLAISQKQILSNYQAIANAFLINHVALTADENVGMHDCLTLRPQSGDPTTALGQSALYNKLISSIPQLFYRPASDQTPVQLSNANLNTIQTGALPSTQVSFLAGPFTVYLGFIDNVTNNQLITLTPSSTLKYVGLSTILPASVNLGQATTVAAFGITANTFTIAYNNTNDGIPNPKLPTIYYLAVGL
jgi:hypothetical protein